jgi:hypothetical protein
MAAMLSIGVTAYAQTTGQSPTQPTSQAGSSRMEQGRQSGDRSQTEQQITLVGCIQREAEYRQANQGGRGGTMGTGIGAGNEFVLINASSGSGSQTAMSGSAGEASGTMTGSATAGTSGTATSGTASTTGSATGTTSGTGSTTGTGTSGTASGTGTTGSASGSSTMPGSTATHTQHSGMSMSAGGTAYALTGDREKDLEQYVGQRVEIVGRVEGGSNRGGYSSGASGSGSGSSAAGSGTSGSGTSATGTTSGTASSGSTTGTGSAGVETTTGTSATGSRTGSGSATASGGSQGQGFASLQQLNVVSFRAVGGSCSAQ